MSQAAQWETISTNEFPHIAIYLSPSFSRSKGITAQGQLPDSQGPLVLELHVHIRSPDVNVPFEQVLSRGRQ